MCRRPLAGFFSRMCTGTPMASPNCPAAAQTRQCVWMSLLQEGLACCLCPVSSGHALRAVQPASESACSFLFLQPSSFCRSFCTFLLYTFCTPSVHLLYTFCTPSAHSVHSVHLSKCGHTHQTLTEYVIFTSQGGVQQQTSKKLPPPGTLAARRPLCRPTARVGDSLAARPAEGKLAEGAGRPYHRKTE